MPERPPFIRISRSDPGAQASNLVFMNALSKNVMVWNRMQKKVPLVKQNVMKFEDFTLGRQRIDQKRKKGGGEGEERGGKLDP